MKTVLVILALLLATGASAAPFIVCDSYVAPAVIPDYFKISVDGIPEVQSPPWSGTLQDGTTRTNALHYDVGAVALGAHAVTVKACKAADPIWQLGEACSAAAPFSFTRPAPINAPNTGTGIFLSR